jgi:hypothetical protein
MAVTVPLTRPMPVISHSTTCPGSTEREWQGVPIRITSPGSSVMWRARSAIT